MSPVAAIGARRTKALGLPDVSLGADFNYQLFNHTVCFFTLSSWNYNKHARVSPKDVWQQRRPRALIRSPSCLKRWISSDHDCTCEQVFVLKWPDLFFLSVPFISRTVVIACQDVSRCCRCTCVHWLVISALELLHLCTQISNVLL